MILSGTKFIKYVPKHHNRPFDAVVIGEMIFNQFGKIVFLELERFVTI